MELLIRILNLPDSARMSQLPSKPLSSWRPSSKVYSGRSSGLSFSVPPRSSTKGESSRTDSAADSFEVCKQPCPDHDHFRKCWYCFEAKVETLRFAGTTKFVTKVYCWWIPFRENENLVMGAEVVEKDGEPTDEDPLADEAERVMRPHWPPKYPKHEDYKDSMLRFYFTELLFKPEAAGHQWVLRFTVQGWGRGESRTLPCIKYVRYDVPHVDENEQPLMTWLQYDEFREGCPVEDGDFYVVGAYDPKCMEGMVWTDGESQSEGRAGWKWPDSSKRKK